MSSEYIGIEEARGKLGDLVTAAVQGVDTVITRHGRPVARLTAYTPEDTVAMLDLSQLAAAVISTARTASPFDTAAEFDYDVCVHYDQSINGIGGQGSPLGAATHRVALERGVDPDQLWQDLQPELQAYATKCKTRRYAGWSTAARDRGARITYA